MKLSYKLTKEELEEALLCLDWRKEGSFRNVNLTIISILGFLVLIGYIRQPSQFFLFLLLVLIVLLLFYMSYGPSIRRKQRAKRLAKKSGEYRLDITENGICYGDKNEKICWSQKRLRVFDTVALYVIKADRETFVIPKRALNKGQEKELEEVIHQQKCDKIHIVIKKE